MQPVLRGTDGDDTIKGFSNQDNILAGGKGSDYLEGGSGKDTYIWNLLDGNDIINDFASGKNFAGQSGILKIGQGVDPANVDIARSGNNLVMTIGETGEYLTIQNWYLGLNYQLGRIEFADGNVWDRSSGKPIEVYFQELAEAASQQSSSGHEESMFAMATMFSFGQMYNMTEQNVGNETFSDKQLIIDIAIAELQMETSSGMACNNGGINISDSENCFAAPSVGLNPTEENKNTV